LSKSTYLILSEAGRTITGKGREASPGDAEGRAGSNEGLKAKFSDAPRDTSNQRSGHGVDI